jgi:hypothetical protein
MRRLGEYALLFFVCRLHPVPNAQNRALAHLRFKVGNAAQRLGEFDERVAQCSVVKLNAKRSNKS